MVAATIGPVADDMPTVYMWYARTTEADAADRDHAWAVRIAEHGLAREGGDDLADHAEAGQLQDVHLG